MTIEQSQVVDSIGIDKETGKVTLTISDHLDWSDPDKHILIMQDKINTYLSFIESGELIESYPDSRGRIPVIDVVGRVPMPPEGALFIEKARQIMQPAGIELLARTFAES